VTATLSILFGGAMKESGKLLGFHVSLTIFLILRFLWLVATGLANGGGNNA
jgi:hypothetical protein